MQNLSQFFKTLADETRLSILSLLLTHGELCVCDIEHVLGITQSKSSRHLRYLRNAGLLDDRRQGTWIHYRISRNLDKNRRRFLKALTPLLSGLPSETFEKRLRKWQRMKHRGSLRCPPPVKSSLAEAAGEKI